MYHAAKVMIFKKRIEIKIIRKEKIFKRQYFKCKKALQKCGAFNIIERIILKY